jgi:hypothetical protein
MAELRFSTNQAGFRTSEVEVGFPRKSEIYIKGLETGVQKKHLEISSEIIGSF